MGNAKRTQLFHHDNGNLEFRKLDIVGQSVTQFDPTGEPLASWFDPYEGLYPFNGYGNVPADAVQPAYSRSCHLEIHDILHDDLKPPNSKDTNAKNFYGWIADDRGNQIATTKKPRSIYDKLTLVFSIALILEIILLFGLR